jgi:hypothetical protein
MSKMVASQSSDHILDLVTKALKGSHKVGDAIAMPILLVPGHWVPRSKGERVEQVAEAWFRENGFFAERSHRGGRGYAELFRDIMSWDTWDVETLRQQYRDSLDVQESTLSQLGLLNTEEKRQTAALVRAMSEETHEEGLTLIEIMTEQQFDNCYQAVFESYEDEEGSWAPEFSPAPGAPDLFVWHSNPAERLWFFCEVKKYGDYLRTSQYAWVRQWWTQIEGRVVLLGLDTP